MPRPSSCPACFLCLLLIPSLTAAFLPALSAKTRPSNYAAAASEPSPLLGRVRCTLRQAHVLSTAFEWLAIERAMDQAYGNFSWFDPSLASSSESEFDRENEQELPLYPLPATYVPSSINHTLNNVEPRNLQMTKDLMEGQDRRFCVVLRASDTGRIASVGTIMQIIQVDSQLQQGSLRRMVVKCQAIGLVDIVSIVNPRSASPQQRLLRSPEYIKCRIRPREIIQCDFNQKEALIARIVDDFRVVRSLYLKGDGELPPFAIQHLADALPEWTAEDLATEAGFWDAAQTWQTLCYTVRENRQMMLSSDRNEIMVAAACKKEGPLQLPIHVEDLSPGVRYQLEEMEVQAQSDFLQLGLDPCLDFQCLLSVRTQIDQLELLAKMVSRERQRLENVSQNPIIAREKRINQDISRKGAWFEGFQ